jgi:hypothetical protein
MTAANAPAPRRSRVRRWLWRTALALLAARALLAVSLPWLADLAAGTVGLAVHWRSASLSLATLSLHVHDLVVADRTRPAAPPLLTAHELAADLSLWALLRGDLVVVDASVAGATVALQVAADGSLHLPAAFAPAAASPPAEPASVPPPAAATAAFPQLPRIGSARLHDVRVQWFDAAPTPALRHELRLHAAATELGRSDRPGHIEIRADHAPSGAHLHLAADVTTAAQRAELAWRLALTDVPAELLADVAAVTAPAGVERFALRTQGTARATGDAAAPQFDGTLEATLHGDREPWLAITAAARTATPPAPGTQLYTAELKVTGMGLVDDLRAEGVRCTVSADTVTADASLQLRGLTLARLQPLLARAGITLPEDGLDASARTHVSLRIAGADRILDAHLAELVVGRGDDRVHLPACELHGLRLQRDGIEVERLAIDGPRLDVVRGSDGSLRMAGVQFAPPRDQPPSTPPPPVAPTPTALPNVVLHTVTWRGAEVTFRDASDPTRPPLLLRDVTLAGAQLACGRTAAPGTLQLRARSPELLDGLELDATLTPAPDRASLAIALRGRGLAGARLAPWLAPLGLQPTWGKTDFGCDADATVTTAADAARLDLTGTNLRFADGETVWFAVRTVALPDIALVPTGATLGAITVDAPELRVHEGADGSLTFAGLRHLPMAPAPVAATPPIPARAAAAGTIELPFTQVALRGARLQWRSERDGAAATAALGLDTGFGPRVAGETAWPWQMTLRADDAIDALHLAGSLDLAHERIAARATLDARGLRGDGLSRFLPPELRCTLRDGALAANVHAAAELGGNGAATFGVDGLVLRDGGDERFAVDRVILQVPVLTTTRVHIARCDVAGVRGAAEQTPAGLHVPGFLLAPAAAASSVPATTTTTVAMPATPRTLPALRLDAFAVELQQFVFRDRTSGDGAPVTASLHVRLAEPWATADDLPTTPPLRLVADAQCLPLCERATVRAQVWPFRTAPEAEVDLVAAGIDMRALPAVFPALAPRLEGLASGAHAEALAHLRLDLRRNDVAQFDLSRPFGAELRLERVLLRAAAEGEVLAGVQEVDVVAGVVDPARGSLLLRSVDIDRPQLRVHRSAEGLELLGLRLRPPPPASTVPAAATDVPPPPTPASPTTTAAGGDLTIDRLHVQGLEVAFTDATTSPPTRLPLADFDFELLRFSTAAFTEARPFAFELTGRGDRVDLERRIVRSSAAAGLVAAAVGALAGTADRHETEARPLFEDLLVAGRLQLAPSLVGRVRATVSGFELPALRGLLRNAGVELADGLLDVGAKLEFAGRDGMAIDSASTFTWLSLSEPPGGPISTWLKLPAPLDSVLFVLRNDAQEIRLPVQVHVPAQGVSTRGLAALVAETLARVIAQAVAASPLRAAGTITGLLGLGGDAEPCAGAVSFAAGGTGFDPAPLAAAIAAVQAEPQLRLVLQHEFGAGDFAPAAALATPPRAEVVRALDELQRQRQLLTARRVALAADAEALLVAGRPALAAGSLHALQALDAELGALEGALDASFDLLDGDTGAATARRTRAAALALAEARLAAVHRWLAARLPQATIERRRVRPAATDGLPAGGRITFVGRRHTNP